MKKLVIMEPAHSTHIEFNPITKQFSMKGHTIPANAAAFFKPIAEWTEDYINTNPDKTVLNVSFAHLHTGAARQVFELIKLLKKSEKNGNALTVNWYYEEEDDDMKQLGLDFSSVLKMEFNFVVSAN